MTPEQFQQAHPGLFFLVEDEVEAIDNYLGRLGVLAKGEGVVSAGRAGEGNMNMTVRVRTVLGSREGRSLIVKQSRPWVERYPAIEAPRDRVLGEARFYRLTSAYAGVAERLPKLIEVDPDARVMVLEDLGAASDYTGAYGSDGDKGGEPIDPADVATLARWLSALHAIDFNAIDFNAKSRTSLPNHAMRRLNHEHLFRFPLDPQNGLDLDAITPGLRGEADRLASDRGYAARVEALGEVYLGKSRSGTRPSLLHGDFFPGSWLRTASGPAVIDPEFAFFGPPEFDVGVLLGHLYLAGQGEPVHAAAIKGYAAPAAFDWRLAYRFAAVEIMRRLIGVAQLPLALGLEGKQSLLRLSQELIVADDPLASPAIRARGSLPPPGADPPRRDSESRRA